MALENKKSSLQPSSTQSQQFRLQFSNLAPNGVAPATLTGGNRGVANNPPAVSAFVNAPAPVSLTAPATIPPALPAPAPAPAPGPVEIPINWVSTAMNFDGNTYISASGDLAKMPFFYQPNGGGGLNGSLYISYRTPGGSDDHGPWSPKEVLFHSYSGSFMSQSLEIYLTGSNLVAEFSHNGARSIFNGNVPPAHPSPSRSQKLSNGYHLIRFDMGRYPRYYPSLDNTYGEIVLANIAGLGSAVDLRNNTDLVIGQNFSGSIGEIVISSKYSVQSGADKVLTASQKAQILDNTLPVRDAAYNNSILIAANSQLGYDNSIRAYTRTAGTYVTSSIALTTGSSAIPLTDSYYL